MFQDIYQYKLNMIQNIHQDEIFNLIPGLGAAQGVGEEEMGKRRSWKRFLFLSLL